MAASRTNSVDTIDPKVRSLLERGVVMPHPTSVYVGEEVEASRIAPGVMIHPGSRLRGARTSIGPGCVVGLAGPVTLENCQLAQDVSLGAGFFADSTFLAGVTVGSCASIRPGTLLEEGAKVGHSVGLKQTVLFPFVTLGSLINFCDCLMAGGTGPRNHSEVGSSYIHFNFTPHQDKATASLLGDVPRGVMLAEAPIFLGGQGGLVGPARIAFGTVVAAGVVCREDVLEEGLLYTGSPSPAGARRRVLRKFAPGNYRGIGRVFRNNFYYIGNIRALLGWYRLVRKHLMVGDPYQEACLEGAVSCLEAILAERLLRLGEVVQATREARPQVGQEGSSSLAVNTAEAYEQLCESWTKLLDEAALLSPEAKGAAERDQFLAAWQRVPPLTPYSDAVAALDSAAKRAATAWLQTIVEEIMALLPPQIQAASGGEL